MRHLNILLFCTLIWPIVGLTQPYWLNDGLVAYYPFDGDAIESSGNGNNGEVINADWTQGRFGALQTAILFKGNTSYVDVNLTSLPVGNSSRTFSVWVKNIENRPDGCVFDYGAEPNGQRFSLLMVGNRPYFSGQNYDFHSDDELGGNWRHLVLTYDGESVSLYLDGVVNKREDFSLNTVASILRIGARIVPGQTEDLSASVDDLRIYNRALSATEIAALYKYESTPPVPMPDSKYVWIEGNYTWEQANLDARERGGHLATITSSQEFNEVLKVFPDTRGPGHPLKIASWLGGTDEVAEGVWQWVTGEPWAYEAWAESQPDNWQEKQHHLILLWQNRLWGDEKKNFSCSYILELDSEQPYPASAKAQILNGFVVGTEVIFEGTGYKVPPIVRFSGGGSPTEEAEAEAILKNGSVESIVIINAGSGYSEMPQVLIAAPLIPVELKMQVSKVESTIPETDRPRIAIVKPEVFNGFVVGASLVDGGKGYTETPRIFFSDANGTGAVGSAIVEDGVVIAVDIIKAGLGYSSEVVMRVDPPPFNPEAIPRVTEIAINMGFRFPNNFYRLEASANLIDWFQVGDTFFAEEKSHTVNIRVDRKMQFFRVIQQP